MEAAGFETRARPATQQIGARGAVRNSVRFVLPFVACLSAFARTQDPRALLSEIADSAQAAHSWRIAGTMKEVLPGEAPFDASFTLAINSTGDVKFAMIGASTPGTIACTPSTSLQYSPPLHRYHQAQRSNVCSPIIGDWESLPSTFLSPKMAESRRYVIGEKSGACQVIRGYAGPEAPATERLKREVCVDPAQHSVIWDRIESNGASQMWIYTQIDRDPTLTAEELTFMPPPGTFSTDYDLPLPHRLGSLEIAHEDGVSPAKIRSKVDPEFDETSRKARANGTVVLYLVVDERGIPANMIVYRSSNPDLNAEAMRAVGKWRFYPATKDKQPVAFASMVEIQSRSR